MTEEISKTWILEQLAKVYESVKKDIERIENKFSNFTTHDLCVERRMSDIKEIKRVDTRIDNIDDDIESTKINFDKKWDTLTFWIWGLLVGVVVELVGLLSTIIKK